MFNRNILYLLCINLLFTSIYGLSKIEVLNRNDGYFYCKDDICVSAYDDNLGTIIIPNKDGKNVTYITETCSATDIDLDLCSSKECTADSECLSNKCLKGHCCFNKENPITECQYVRTVHNDPLFGDPKGYRMQCGLPMGDECSSNDDCSSYNCEKYKNKTICGTPDDSGCHSLCGVEQGIFALIGLPILLIILFCSCCICFIVQSKKGKSKNNLSAV